MCFQAKEKYFTDLLQGILKTQPQNTLKSLRPACERFSVVEPSERGVLVMLHRTNCSVAESVQQGLNS